MSLKPLAARAAVHCSGVRKPPFGRQPGTSTASRNELSRLNTSSRCSGVSANGRTHSAITSTPPSLSAFAQFTERRRQVAGNMQYVDAIDEEWERARSTLLQTDGRCRAGENWKRHCGWRAERLRCARLRNSADISVR